MRKRLAAAAALVALAAGCGGGGARPPAAPHSLLGGTLRVAALFWSAEEKDASEGIAGKSLYLLDPQAGGPYATSTELFRCCLVRTLLSYAVGPHARGAVLRPDLAAAMPAVDDRGLVWTFRLRHGLHYAPPFQQVEITAPDVVRALERAMSPAPSAWARRTGERQLGGYVSVYDRLIAGARAYESGRARTISGLVTPDRYTLVVHLLHPSGDLGYRFSLAETAPIPPLRSELLGAAAGHEDGYGRFLVASGPYMIAGSQNLDFSRPAARQRPVSGWVPGRSIVLVRNPSWRPGTDPLRAAYADRIVITDLPAPATDAGFAAADRLVDRGRFDLLLDAGASDEQLARSDARLHVTEADISYFFALNLALPPFDDVHVRRAVNLVLEKARLRRLAGDPLRWSIAGHIVPDGLEDDLLVGYDPYRTPGGDGSVRAARAEMARSRYDRNRDGICDVRACTRVPAIELAGFNAHVDEMYTVLASDLAKLGIRLEIRKLGVPAYFRAFGSPAAKVGLSLGSFQKVLPLAGDFFAGWLDRLGRFPPAANPSLVGVARSLLLRYGYPVTSVPSVHAEIARCEPITGEEQTQCWAELDQLLMEKVVPWVPWLFERNTREVSARVRRFAFDPLTSLPALDQVAVGQSPTP